MNTQQCNEILNNQIQTIEQLSNNSFEEKQRELETKKKKEDEYLHSEEYHKKQQEISEKKEKIKMYDDLINKKKKIEEEKGVLDEKKITLKSMKLLEKMLQISHNVELQLSLINSNTPSSKIMKDLLTILKDYQEMITNETIEIPKQMNSLYSQFILSFQYYINQSNSIISNRLINYLKAKKFPFVKIEKQEEWEIIKSDYQFLRNIHILQPELNDVSTNSLMENSVLKVQHLFQREESKLYQPTSLDLVLPYIIETIENAEQQLSDNKIEFNSLMTPFIPILRFRMLKDIKQLPGLYVLMLLDYIFKYIERYPSLLLLLKEKDICDDINIALKESADLKVEYITKMDNNLWSIPLHRGGGEFMMMLNEAVSFCLKAGTFANELIVSYVFEMVIKFEEYMKKIEMTGLKEVCGLANSWKLFGEALKKNTERMKEKNVSCSILLSRIDEYEKEAKSAVLVIVEDIDRLLEEEHYSTFNEAVESSIYLRKRKEEIQSYLHPSLYNYFTEKINE
ncbi:hypothetical protein EDI_290980 [Entamoeba dispar SAW760]|uniref:Uncharacterized protein n=1 Tax=Entamoeba dispar (strain ATCC PRA-260 / SAW760) TaxID=370354 RepID=B0ECP3_ENTDS|nr:uncharacterized protein EDI_290980 [Entamoeba dispar SAW760]EDR27705.1 hypothetical protein EDI_290980 [Entamoeba dispar SAW760]|eukprot:EDR27705.1 hypothetical protein EDI_290980 [Entamoeba dispar SAW760]